MIIVKLKGGLGNQMFQYAAGRSLVHRLGGELKLDATGFPDHNQRVYELGAFDTLQSFATAAEIERGKRQKPDLLRRLLGKAGRPSPDLYREKSPFHYDPDFEALRDNAYLDGYFQSERYFAGVEALIRKEFTVRQAMAAENRALADRIDQLESVSLHIRRGDYVADEKTHQRHGTCDLAYYEHCAREIAKAITAPSFFVFSNDPEWVRKHLELPFPLTIVDHNDPGRGCEDMRLMSRCRHQIIANSSFSWWGAWLNPNKSKIVYAPDRWLSDMTARETDLFPVGWRVV